MATAVDPKPERTSSSHEEPLYEIVAGARVELPPMGMREVLIATALSFFLRGFARERGLGRVVTEGLFPVHPSGDPKRRPDVAFVSYARWPRERPIPPTNDWDVVPDLAIEVVSPTNTAAEILAKIREYFRAGVRRVWVVYPTERQVYDYADATRVRIASDAEALEGGELLPGLRLPVADLFEDLGDPPTTA